MSKTSNALITLFCLNLYLTTLYSQEHTADKTQVIIIGTIHSAHYKNPNYSPDKLKEIVLSLKPDAILNELPLSQVDPNGRPLYRNKKKNPEGWAADTVAQQLGIKQIPFDRPDRQENFRKTEYFKRQKRDNKLANDWYEEIVKNNPDSIDLKIALLLWQNIDPTLSYLSNNSTPEMINSQAYDNLIRAKKSIWYDILPKILADYNGYETLSEDYKFSKDQWLERNKIMADNIIKAARQYPGKRLFVITGSYHRYILRDLLKDNPNIDLKEYWEVKNMLNSDNNETTGLFAEPSEGNNMKPDSTLASNAILHIMPHSDWNNALNLGQYRPKSLNVEGFIHCSTSSQIIGVANHKFKGQQGLVLLVIDPQKVKPPIKWEGEKKNLFPHIYGPLNLDAVIKVLDFPPTADGTFELPIEIQKDTNSK